MFEKESEEYLKTDGTKAEQILNMLNEISPLKIKIKQLPFVLAMLQQIYQDGAEFGYNKANEWHYVKDRLPELNKKVLLKLDCEEKYDVGYLGVGYTEPLWYTSNGEEIAVKVIKWKEIE